MSNNTPDRGPERPRVEPEILLPGEEPRARREESDVWMRFEGPGGMHRIFVARPGWPSIIVAVLILGLVAAIAFIVLAGLVVLWIPLVIIGILMAIVPGTVRSYWNRVKALLPGGR